MFTLHRVWGLSEITSYKTHISHSGHILKDLIYYTAFFILLLNLTAVAITCHPPPSTCMCWHMSTCMYINMHTQHACTSDCLQLDTSGLLNTACTFLPPCFGLLVPLGLKSVSLSSLSKSYPVCESHLPLPVKLFFILSVVINRMLSFHFSVNVCLCCRS